MSALGMDFTLTTEQDLIRATAREVCEREIGRSQASSSSRSFSPTSPSKRRQRVDEDPVGKYLRDPRVTTLYEGTSQIQKLIIGRALTGESAFT